MITGRDKVSAFRWRPFCIKHSMTKQQSNGQQARNSRTLAVITPNSQDPEFSRLKEENKVMPFSRWIAMSEPRPEVKHLTIEAYCTPAVIGQLLAISAHTGRLMGEIAGHVLNSDAMDTIYTDNV